MLLYCIVLNIHIGTI